MPKTRLQAKMDELRANARVTRCLHRIQIRIFLYLHFLRIHNFFLNSRKESGIKWSNIWVQLISTVCTWFPKDSTNSPICIQRTENCWSLWSFWNPRVTFRFSKDHHGFSMQCNLGRDSRGMSTILKSLHWNSLRRNLDPKSNNFELIFPVFLKISFWSLYILCQN